MAANRRGEDGGRESEDGEEEYRKQVARFLDGRRRQLVETGIVSGCNDRPEAGAAVEHNMLRDVGPIWNMVKR